MSDVSVKEVDKLIEDLKTLENAKETAEEVVTSFNKQIATLEGRIVHYLKELGREDYDSPYGKVKITQKWRVNLPKTDTDKLALFDHFKSRGIFERYATVNSNSLNSLYMKDWEDAKDRGMGLDFSMPGVPPPTLFEALNFKAKK